MAKTIAVVGLSASPLRPSYGVAAYMQSQGYRIIPVNPLVTEVLGGRGRRPSVLPDSQAGGFGLGRAQPLDIAPALTIILIARF